MPHAAGPRRWHNGAAAAPNTHTTATDPGHQRLLCSLRQARHHSLRAAYPLLGRWADELQCWLGRVLSHHGTKRVSLPACSLPRGVHRLLRRRCRSMASPARCCWRSCGGPTFCPRTTYVVTPPPPCSDRWLPPWLLALPRTQAQPRLCSNVAIAIQKHSQLGCAESVGPTAGGSSDVLVLLFAFLKWETPARLCVNDRPRACDAAAAAACSTGRGCSRRIKRNLRPVHGAEPHRFVRGSVLGGG